MAKVKFTVVRDHYGDKQYRSGDIREVEEKSVAHLIPHVLCKGKPPAKPKAKLDVPAKAKPKAKPKAKAAPKVENKSVGDAPENKAGE